MVETFLRVRSFMAFNKLQPADGPFFLAPGESMRIWVTRDNESDFGAQWIMADPNDESHPAELTVSNFSKERAYHVGNTQGQFSEPFTRYWVTATNTGDFPTHFTVQGGGNV